MTGKPTINDLRQAKQSGRKIKMLTAYDFPLAQLIDRADVDIILVGDSLANVMLGLDSTKSIGMEEMLYHSKAVCRGVQRTLVVGDMPSGSYGDAAKALANARRFMDEAGCDAVKLEWFEGCQSVVRELTEAGINVMGHVGLTPQTAENFVVQGKDAHSARAILDQTRQLETWGCFAVVLECIPKELAKIITNKVSIPTIGIGAGVNCDGQVLVTHDLLGLYDRFRPKFAKRYLEAGNLFIEALNTYARDVDGGSFPSDEHSFTIDKTQLDQLQD
ncbi:MAG: 3-methyl-2-oxobutanoate hydroxymethyltransferase [Candidatus Omnitrophica bacterium]|nr:3-methyl-2-oxobutanoate hydroxymethyltransferase [Candidatus Omnitrophota bacterium]